MAYAMATPSCVDVPRPSSSIMTSERGVADTSAVAASCSSTINVLDPRKMLSLAPMLRGRDAGGHRGGTSEYEDNKTRGQPDGGQEEKAKKKSGRSASPIARATRTV